MAIFKKYRYAGYTEVRYTQPVLRTFVWAFEEVKPVVEKIEFGLNEDHRRFSFKGNNYYVDYITGKLYIGSDFIEDIVVSREEYDVTTSEVCEHFLQGGYIYRVRRRVERGKLYTYFGRAEHHVRPSTVRTGRTPIYPNVITDGYAGDFPRNGYEYTVFEDDASQSDYKYPNKYVRGGDVGEAMVANIGEGSRIPLFSREGVKSTEVVILPGIKSNEMWYTLDYTYDGEFADETGDDKWVRNWESILLGTPKEGAESINGIDMVRETVPLTDFKHDDEVLLRLSVADSKGKVIYSYNIGNVSFYENVLPNSVDGHHPLEKSIIGADRDFTVSWSVSTDDPLFEAVETTLFVDYTTDKGVKKKLQFMVYGDVYNTVIPAGTIPVDGQYPTDLTMRVKIVNTEGVTVWSKKWNAKLRKKYFRPYIGGPGLDDVGDDGIPYFKYNGGDIYLTLDGYYTNRIRGRFVIKDSSGKGIYYQNRSSGGDGTVDMPVIRESLFTDGNDYNGDYVLKDGDLITITFDRLEVDGTPCESDIMEVRFKAHFAGTLTPKFNAKVSDGVVEVYAYSLDINDRWELFWKDDYGTYVPVGKVGRDEGLRYYHIGAREGLNEYKAVVYNRANASRSSETFSVTLNRDGPHLVSSFDGEVLRVDDVIETSVDTSKGNYYHEVGGGFRPIVEFSGTADETLVLKWEIRDFEKYKEYRKFIKKSDYLGYTDNEGRAYSLAVDKIDEREMYNPHYWTINLRCRIIDDGSRRTDGRSLLSE